MTQEQFLTDMIDTGYVSVKADELRTLLQNYNKLKKDYDKALFTIKLKQNTINFYKNLENERIVKEPIKIDLEV